ncbi:MAG: hypothetical protein ABIE55_04535 [Candidatus Aenigmatarchaeota archaeon]
MDGLTTGLAYVAGLGLPQILLWVLTFAIVFELMTKLKILGRAPAAIVSVITGLFVLMAVPTAVITAIATMSTGLVVASIGFLVVLSLIEIGQIRIIGIEKNKEGKDVAVENHPFKIHGRLMTLAVMAVAAVIFVVAGGPALIGITAFPAIGMGTWVLIVIGVAVLWMVSESGKM